MMFSYLLYFSLSTMALPFEIVGILVVSKDCFKVLFQLCDSAGFVILLQIQFSWCSFKFRLCT